MCGYGCLVLLLETNQNVPGGEWTPDLFDKQKARVKPDTVSVPRTGTVSLTIGLDHRGEKTIEGIDQLYTEVGLIPGVEVRHCWEEDARSPWFKKNQIPLYPRYPLSLSETEPLAAITT